MAGIDLLTPEGSIIVGTGMGLSDSFMYSSGLPSGYMGQLPEKIKNALKTPMKVIVIANACCAGAQAIAYGYDIIKAGYGSAVIAGGAEGFSRITEGGFRRLGIVDETGCKPFDYNRKGIAIGSGGCFFALSDNRRGCIARLRGAAVTNDAHHSISPEPGGDQLRRAILQALGQACAVPDEIHAVIAHGTGTRLNDEIEAAVLHGLFGTIDVTAPKGSLGHTGGASGAFGLLAAVYALKHQTLPPIANLHTPDPGLKVMPVYNAPLKKRLDSLLVNAISFGGTNTAMICGRVAHEES